MFDVLRRSAPSHWQAWTRLWPGTTGDINPAATCSCRSDAIAQCKRVRTRQTTPH